MPGFAYVRMLVFVLLRLVKNRCKRIICLHTFIERVIHSRFVYHAWVCSCSVVGVCSFATCVELLPIDFIESSRHVLERGRHDPVES